MKLEKSGHKVLTIAIRILVGSAFLLSGFVKLVPAEYLENDIIRSGLGNDFTAPFMARIVIGSELFFGLGIITGIYARLVLRLSLLILIVYTLYLVYMIFRFGNEGNCGCFGHRFELTPLEGIGKNLLLGLGCWFLMRSSGSVVKSLFKSWILISLAIISLVSPFIIYKVDLPESIEIKGERRELIDFSPLYTGIGSDTPPFDIRSGKALVMFGSLSCEHCRVAANKLEVLKTLHPDWPVYIVYNGKSELIPDFHQEAQIKNTPCFLFNDGESLAKMVGVGLPVIMLVEDATVIARLQYPELREENLLSFFTAK